MLHTLFAPVLHVYGVVFHLAYVTLTGQLVISGLTDMAWTCGIVAVLVGLLMAHRRTRRVTVTVMRFTLRHAPRWGKWLLAAAAFFPGQADEAIVIPVVLAFILANARNRRVLCRQVAYAWRKA